MSHHTQMIERIYSSFKSTTIAAGVLCSFAMAPSLAVAAPIGNASFGIGGAFTLPAGSNLGNTNSLFISNGGAIIVSVADTADLFGIVTLGQLGTLKDLPSISGFVPIANYLTLASGVSVNLSTLQSVYQQGPIPNVTGGFINLTFNAVVNAPGFTSTPGSLTFTGNSSDNRSFSLAVTTSASSPPVQEVPEPMSLALLGLGLLGLFGIARRRTNASTIV